MFFKRSSAEQLPSRLAIRTAATDADVFDMTLTGLAVGCFGGWLSLSDDRRRARDHGDVAGARDSALEVAFGVLVEHVDGVALGAGLECLAAHRDRDAGHLVVQGHHLAAL